MARALIALLLLITPAWAEPARYASINLCTDQLLLDLADRDTIIGLSPYAADPKRSWAAEKARGLTILSGMAEDVLLARPTLVLAGTFNKRATRDLLKAQGLMVEEFAPARSIAEAKAQITRMANLIGRPERARTRLAAIDAALERAKAAATRRPLRALVMQRRGWVSGTDSLATSLIATVGLANAASDIGSKAGRLMRLEEVLQLKPDLLVLSADNPAADDQGAALLSHPALAAIPQRLVLPENLSICGGPMLDEALDSLTRQLERLAP